MPHCSSRRRASRRYSPNLKRIDASGVSFACRTTHELLDEKSRRSERQNHGCLLTLTSAFGSPRAPEPSMEATENEMSKILICGGGVIGLCAAMMLGRDGHRVTVMEAAPEDQPSTSIQGWDSWHRPGVAQFKQPHSLHSRFRMISDRELPGLTNDLIRAGGVWVDYLDSRSLPPTITDRAPRPGDAAMRCVAGRRPVIEWAVAALAHAAPNVRIRRGT